ncbi:serine/threonine protein kinase [Thermoplasmatales archaeon]|nr:serine/threonine protein kinase [Thermoplasmatales archaeon]
MVHERSLKGTLKKIEDKYQKKGYSEAWVQERVKIEELITQTYELIIADKYEVNECIAVAGSRIVLKMTDRTNKKEYALKISRPLKDSVGMLQEEYSILNSLYHPNLIQIFDKKDLICKNDEINYLATVEEFVPGGLDLEKWCKTLIGSEPTPDTVIKHINDFSVILEQLADVLWYLHKNEVYHCDIKPENILVKDNSPKLVDFGYSHRIYLKEDPVDKIGFTWDFALPKLREFIHKYASKDAVFTLNEGEISYLRIEQYALGRTLEACLLIYQDTLNYLKEKAKEPEDARAELYQDVNYIINYLKLIALRLKGVDSYEDKLAFQNIPDRFNKEMIRSLQYLEQYSCWKEMKRDLQKLRIDNLATIAPEWQSKLGSTIRIGELDVPFTTRVRKLYNHIFLSRLANVSQLGMIAYVYPSARHSRLEHSMGTYYYSIQYIKALWEQKDDPLFRCLAQIEEVQAATLGALFHDIGQYPHAHDLEDSSLSNFKHETLSQQLYKYRYEQHDEEIRSLYDLVSENWGRTVADQVDRYLESSKEAEGSNDLIVNILRNIISSSIDADKLDYLQRDAANLGLSYPSNIEVDRLVLSLRPAIIPDKSGQTGHIQLGVTSKGILAARSLMSARENMFERVYWHKTVRSFKAMLMNALIIEGPEGIDSLQAKVKEIVFSQSYFTSLKLEKIYPESFHLVYSDILFLDMMYKVLTDDSAKILIEYILKRKHYHNAFELSSSYWKPQGDIKRVEEITNKLRDLTKAGTQSVEKIRQFTDNLNNLLFNQYEITHKGIDGRLARKIGFIIDLPPERVLGKSLYLVEPDTFSSREIVPESLLTGNKEGVVSSLFPRLYMHPDISFQKFPTKNEFLNVLKEAL